jgi:DNA repair exonuclease SbcCD ATPase subunit
MRILSVDIIDFLSIKEAHFDFEDSGLVLVEGWNHDVGRANGAGKTAIFNALSYGIFGKLPRKVTATEIQRRGTKSACVTVKIRSRDGNEVSVSRFRPSGLVFKQNGVEQTWTQEEWEKKIGITYNQFLITMYCSQSTSGRFLSLNDSAKKDFILQLLELNEFTASKDKVDELIDGVQKAVSILENALSSDRARITAYEESLIDEFEAQASLASIKATITSVSNEITALQRVATPDLSKYSKIQKEIEEKKAEFAALKQKRSMLHDQYRKITSKIKPFQGEDNCFNCGATMDTTQARNVHEQQCSNLSSEAIQLKSAIDDCDFALAKEAQVLGVSSKLKDKISQETRDYDTAQIRINELERFLVGHKLKEKDICLKIENNGKLQDKVRSLRIQSESVQKEIAKHKTEIELYKTVSAAYSPTGAQAYVLDGVVDAFNKQMEGYVALIWPNASYKLLSYKENAKGDVVAKFSETLTMDGQEVSIGSLSGGEARALSICADFAIIDIMEEEFGLSLNPIILDEPFNDLDAVGREFIVDILETIATNRQIFVVDHASEAKAMFSQVIRIEKRDGISEVHLES